MEAEKYCILIVDDEPDVLEFLGYNLRKEGFVVYSCSNGKEAISIATEKKPDLILLDVMMPEMDGIETCRILRQIESLQHTLIAFLTARNEDYSQIAGFDAGGDDYIAKPIKPRVLISRIKALLKRKITPLSSERKKDEQPIIQAGDLIIDRDQYKIRYRDNEFRLPRKEFELLALLASRPGKVFTRNEILSAVWGEDVFVGDRTIDVHIRKLREKLQLSQIRTIKGVGYMFSLLPEDENNP